MMVHPLFRSISSETHFLSRSAAARPCLPLVLRGKALLSSSPSATAHRILRCKSENGWDFGGLREIIDPPSALDDVKIYLISDLHTDYDQNMDWIRGLLHRDYHDHVLLLPGDISDDLRIVRATLEALRDAFGQVIFTPGNHDIWVRGSDPDLDPRNEGCGNSLEKLQALLDMCENIGIATGPVSIGGVVVIPLYSWHHKDWDTERDIPGFPPLSLACADYHACRWPADMTGSQKKGSLELAQWFDGLNDDPSLALPGRRPVGSSAADRTDCEVSMADSAPTSLTTGEAGEDGPQRPRRGIQRLHCSAAEAARMAREASLDIVTMSHFLPHQCLLPEKRFLIYPSFAKMSGSAPLGSRVASIEPAVHVFGHTHFSWDTTDTVSGTRFVQAPLSTPAEREGRPGSLIMLPRDAIRRDASHGSPERTPLEDAMREHASEAPWLPLCLGWCTEEGFVGGQGTFAHWSGYYERENRDPDNIELAPWVKGRWKGRMKRGRWE